MFEADHSGILRWKRELLANAAIDGPPSTAYVPVDFERDELLGVLQRAGVRTDEPACIGWMGVRMDLAGEAVVGPLAALAGFAPGTCLCFHHSVLASTLGPFARAALQVIATRAGEVGEPWRSAFDSADLRAQLLGLGFRDAQAASAADLNARYLDQRNDGLRVGGGAGLMRAIR